nr:MULTISPECIES: SCO1664 family protein [unclassified Ornithinimicrobium]
MTSEPGRAGTEDLEPAGQFEVEGVLTDASNLTARVLYTTADGQPTGRRGLYKPIRGEAPLRDFPEGTLGRREVAAFLVSEAGGWGLIPRTIMSEGPLGPGSVQRWIDWEPTGRGPGDGLLEIFPAGAVPSGWLAVVHGEGAEGQPVAVAHQDAPDLASLAVLDVVLNNADRKGAHLVRDAEGHLWGFDHGLTLHAEDKLRTVLWGWAGQPLPADDVERLQTLRDSLSRAHADGAGTAAPADGHAPPTTADSAGTAISALISPWEFQALSDRVDELLTEAIFPALPTERYALPWPLW